MSPARTVAPKDIAAVIAEFLAYSMEQARKHGALAAGEISPSAMLADLAPSLGLYRSEGVVDLTRKFSRRLDRCHRARDDIAAIERQLGAWGRAGLAGVLPEAPPRR
jgi:hypothetical protein